MMAGHVQCQAVTLSPVVLTTSFPGFPPLRAASVGRMVQMIVLVYGVV